MSFAEQFKPLLEDKSYLRHFWHPVATVAEFERANASGHQNFWRMPTTAATCDVVDDGPSVPSIHAWPTPDDAFW